MADTSDLDATLPPGVVRFTTLRAQQRQARRVCASLVFVTMAAVAAVSALVQIAGGAA